MSCWRAWISTRVTEQAAVTRHHLNRKSCALELSSRYSDLGPKADLREITAAGAKAGLRSKQSRTRHESNDGEKFSSPLDQKKKAGGHYAADLVLQLPARGSGSVAWHSVLLDRST